jgi:predicted MarR family transcription regulator
MEFSTKARPLTSKPAARTTGFFLGDIVIIMEKKNKSAPPVLANAWHLAATPLEAAATELEWALLRWREAFERYQREALSRLSYSNLNTQEGLLLHIIRMQDRPKSTGMIANLLNRDDVQNIQYSLRKLVAEKLVKKVKDGAGKSFNLTVTEKGRQLTDDLVDLRRKILIKQLEGIEKNESRILESAKMVSMMTALYNEAGRISAPTILLDGDFGSFYEAGKPG